MTPFPEQPKKAAQIILEYSIQARENNLDIWSFYALADLARENKPRRVREGNILLRDSNIAFETKGGVNFPARYEGGRIELAELVPASWLDLGKAKRLRLRSQFGLEIEYYYEYVVVKNYRTHQPICTINTAPNKDLSKDERRALGAILLVPMDLQQHISTDGLVLLTKERSGALTPNLLLEPSRNAGWSLDLKTNPLQMGLCLQSGQYRPPVVIMDELRDIS